MPLEDLVETLADLEKEPQLLQHINQEVSIIPRRDQYRFRMKRRRYGVLSATLESELWENEVGHIMIEGEARINGSTILLVLLVFLGPVLFLTSVYQRDYGIIPLMLFLATFILGFAFFYYDRQKMISQIGSSISHLNRTSQKFKHQAGTRLALPNETSTAASSSDTAPEITDTQRGHSER